MTAQHLPIRTRRRRFALQLVACGDPVEAAGLTGYRDPRNAACRLVRSAEVRAHLKRLGADPTLATTRAERRRRFGYLLVVTAGNASEAARLAGYSAASAHVRGSVMLSHPEVRQALARALEHAEAHPKSLAGQGLARLQQAAVHGPAALDRLVYLSALAEVGRSDDPSRHVPAPVPRRKATTTVEALPPEGWATDDDYDEHPPTPVPARYTAPIEEVEEPEPVEEDQPDALAEAYGYTDPFV